MKNIKKLTALTSVAVLTISLGTAAFAMNTNRAIDIKDKAKDMPTITLQKVDSNDSINVTTNNSSASADNFNHMIELEKLRLKQAIDDGTITSQQAKTWEKDIKQIEKNGQLAVHENKNIVTPERFKQMIAIEKDRLQQAIDNKVISNDQADFWKKQIDLMERNYDNKNYDINDIHPTSYGHKVMWSNSFNSNMSKTQQSTEKNTTTQQVKEATVITNTGTNTGHADRNDGYHQNAQSHIVKQATVTTNTSTHIGHNGMNDGYHNTSENHNSNVRSQHRKNNMGGHK